VIRNTIFAARLRALRERAGLTQQALADAAGLHRVQVARFEAGRFAPRWDAVQALADALGVGLEEFRTNRKRK
jgi:transcriptional regulator with XRE-family HTH domain